MTIAKSHEAAAEAWDKIAEAAVPRVPKAGDVWRQRGTGWLWKIISSTATLVTYERIDSEAERPARCSDRPHCHVIEHFDLHVAAPAVGSLWACNHAHHESGKIEVVEVLSVADGRVVFRSGYGSECGCQVDHFTTSFSATSRPAPGWYEPSVTVLVHNAPRVYNAQCPRCGGVATLLLTSIRCERTGGCRTAEERIGPCPEPLPTFLDTRTTGPESGWLCITVPGLTEWLTRATGPHPLAHPTRDGAIALWRAAALKAAR